eukprot:3198175-Pleurochrysis_carterae.AAC.1
MLPARALSRTYASLVASIVSSSLKYSRRSEWPRSTHSIFMSTSCSADTSPVYAPQPCSRGQGRGSGAQERRSRTREGRATRRQEEDPGVAIGRRVALHSRVGNTRLDDMGARRAFCDMHAARATQRTRPHLEVAVLRADHDTLLELGLDERDVDRHRADVHLALTRVARVQVRHQFIELRHRVRVALPVATNDWLARHISC